MNSKSCILVIELKLTEGIFNGRFGQIFSDLSSPERPFKI